MAFDQPEEQSVLSTAPRPLRLWVYGLGLSSFAALLGGLAFAAVSPGRATLWTGAAFVIAMALALVVGASKTSSA